MIEYFADLQDYIPSLNTTMTTATNAAESIVNTCASVMNTTGASCVAQCAIEKLPTDLQSRAPLIATTMLTVISAESAYRAAENGNWKRASLLGVVALVSATVLTTQILSAPERSIANAYAVVAAGTAHVGKKIWDWAFPTVIRR